MPKALSGAVARPTVILSAALGALVWLALASVAAAAETYVHATVDQRGHLRIVTTDHRAIVSKKDLGQVGFAMAAIAPDRRTVGWLALYPSCCTSYPIPLQLVLYASGKRRTFTGNGLPVWRWCFAAGGTQVAFKQETVHGGGGVHDELREVATERFIAAYNPNPDVPGDPPRWVADVDVQR